jgi:TonB-linked SusC/RagA family outer membrane protein
MKKLWYVNPLFWNNNQLLLKMKFIILFLSMGLLNLSASISYSQNTKLTLHLNDVTVKDVFNEIERQSEYLFFYYDEVLDFEKRVDVHVSQQTIHVLMDELLQSTDATYEINDRQILIKKSNQPLPDEQIKIESEVEVERIQNYPVTGTVKDENGNPVPGVSIIIKGTTQGGITDINGEFLINVPDGTQTLVFSFIGMKTQEIQVEDSSTLNVVLREDVLVMDEVLVVGYGTQKKESVVGAISTVSGEELLRAGGATTVSNTLAGKLPGMVTISTSGKPGSDQAQIIIRGVSTWNNSDPLILIDGIERDLDEINIAAIENISMLKDASATAVFGVRGANGVILITTKRGKEGKPRLSFEANTTFKTLSKIPEYANSYETRWLRNEVIEMQVNADESTWADYTPYRILEHYREQDMPYLYPDVDWQEIMLNNYSNSQRYNLDLQGGTEFVKYFTAISYTYDGDMLKGDDLGFGFIPSNDYSRLNLRTNLDFQPTKTTSFSVDLDGSFANDSRMWQTTQNSRRLWNGIYGKAPDMYPVFYEDGFLGYSDIVDPQQENIYYAINYLGMVASTVNNVSTTVDLKQKLDSFIKGLSFTGRFNFNNRYTTTGPTYGKTETVLKYIDPSTGQTYFSYPEQWSRLTHGFNFVEEYPSVSPENVNSNVLRNFQYQAALRYNRNLDDTNLEDWLFSSESAGQLEELSPVTGRSGQEDLHIHSITDTWLRQILVTMVLKTSEVVTSLGYSPHMLLVGLLLMKPFFHRNSSACLN